MSPTNRTPLTHPGPPCASCGTTGGYCKPHSQHPLRKRGLCRNCLRRADRKRRSDQGRPAKVRVRPVAPCDLCGTLGGRPPARAGCRTPSRSDGGRVGLPGLALCASCFEDRSLLYLDPDDEPSEAERAEIEARMREVAREVAACQPRASLTPAGANRRVSALADSRREPRFRPCRYSGPSHYQHERTDP